ncbi:esterase family protein [Hymenobacter sp. RP-2-7]|uniref:Esterase family protein n=1 Tax=Hymenobacter polaris TaxID=2682546 RepID=A0A7Y0ACF8_9BACT|nr:alpha/beta hydrolase-fold protein [Hymenobacter polaris]NML64773.1 esterase family protein [Hymenobacter polaris]
MHEDYRRFYSHHLGLELEMLVLGNYGYPIIIFPTSNGRYYEAKDFKLVDSVRWFIDNKLIKLYCIDSGDKYSWYAKHLHPGTRVWNHTLYDRFVADELVPAIQRECQVDKVGVAGCSLGGYQALNFAFRHPGLVAHMFSMGASFDIRMFMGGYYDEQVYYNNPPDYLPNDQDPDLWRMNIILGTAYDDFCKDSNYQIADILSRKGIAHRLDVRPGTHDWPVWRDMFPEYVSTIF